MGKTNRPKEISLPQVYLEHAVFSDDEESEGEEYVIEIGNDILIITDENISHANDDDSYSETIFSDDDEEQEVETMSDHSNIELSGLNWADIAEYDEESDSVFHEYEAEFVADEEESENFIIYDDKEDETEDYFINKNKPEVKKHLTNEEEYIADDENDESG